MSEVCIEVFGNDAFLEKDSSPFLRLFSLVLLVTTITFITFCYVYFLFHRWRYDYLRKRNVLLLSMLYAGFIIICFSLTYRTYVGVVNYKCGHHQVLATIAINLAVVSSLTRAVILHNRISFNQLAINHWFNSFDASAEVTGLPDLTGSSQMKSSNSSAVPSVLANQHNAGQVLMATNGAQQRSVSKTCRYLLDIIFMSVCWKPPLHLADEVKFSFFLTTNRYIVLFASLLSITLLIPSSLIFRARFLEGYDCLGCSLSVTGLSLVFPIMIAALVFGVIILWRVWRYTDAMGIKKEIRVHIMIMFVFYFILGVLLRRLFPKVEEESVFEFSLLTCFGIMLMAFYSFVLTVWKAKRISCETFKQSALEEALNHSSGAKALALYLAESLALENLLFIEAVKRWKRSYDESFRPVLIQQAVDIYELYIEEYSAYEINISYEVRNNLGSLMKDNQDRINEESFEPALTGVYRNLGSQVSGFMKSKYYKASQGMLD